MAERIRRTTARVLPVSPDGAILLLHEQDPLHPEAPYWSTIGGAVDGGETHLEAMTRELHEETGIVIDPELVVGPVATGSYDYTFNGVDYVSSTTFFAVPLGREADVSFEFLEPDEVGNVLASRWWFPDDLEADGTAAQHDMPETMRQAVAAVRGTG